jgi:hypothetical protein
MSKSDAGKGDTPRKVDPEKFKRNHNAINWCKHEWMAVIGEDDTDHLLCLKCFKEKEL